MGKARFLDELADRAARRLPQDRADALVLEASDHLDAAVAARIELETPPEIAEIEAVAAFGSVGLVVRREVAIRRGRWHSPVLAALTVLGATGIPSVLSGHSDAFFLAVLSFLGLVAPFIMACETRRPWRSLVVGTAAFWLLSTGLLALLCGPYDGHPTGRGTLTDIADLYAGHADARARREAKYDRLGWPSPELRARTQRDWALFATLGEKARGAARTVDLAGSARASTPMAAGFALYLGLLYALGAWCERLARKGSRWGRWDFWRAE